MQAISKRKTILLAFVQAKDNTLESTVLCDLFSGEDDEPAIKSDGAWVVRDVCESNLSMEPLD